MLIIPADNTSLCLYESLAALAEVHEHGTTLYWNMKLCSQYPLSSDPQIKIVEDVRLDGGSPSKEGHERVGSAIEKSPGATRGGHRTAQHLGSGRQ
eukprot:4540855-Pleurochrysis_carterae.AAC.1